MASGKAWVWSDWWRELFHVETSKAKARNNRRVMMAGAGSAGMGLGEAGANLASLTSPKGLPNTRLSTDESVDFMVNNLFKTYASLAVKMPWELLEFLELLAVWNPDMSQAIGNIRRLGNTGFDIIVETGEDAGEKRIKERIAALDAKINNFGGGMGGIVNSLFDSCMTFGSLGVEWVPNESLDDIRDAYLVPVKTVRFAKSGDDWLPFQRAPFGLVRANSDGYIPLNPWTFTYKTLIQHPGSPYGIPPYLAALEPLSIQKDMNRNLKMAMRKVGLLGILDFVVEDLPRMPTDTDEVYFARCQRALETYAKRFSEMASTGALVHFKNDATVNSVAMSGQNVAGAKSIFELNEEQVASGMQTVPAMLGRSYSTTETYAGVLYDDMLAQVGNVRNIVSCAVVEGIRLACLLWGEKPTKIEVKFKPNSPIDHLAEAQAKNMEVTTAITMRNEGLIDQQAAAQMVGLDKPAGEAPKPVVPPVPVLPVNNPNDPNGGGNPPDAQQQKANARKERIYLQLIQGGKTKKEIQFFGGLLEHIGKGCTCHICKSEGLIPQNPVWAACQKSYLKVLTDATDKCRERIWRILNLPEPGQEQKSPAQYTPEQLKRLDQAVQRFIIEEITGSDPGAMPKLRFEYLKTYSAGLYDAAQETGKGTPLLDIVQRRDVVDTITQEGFDLVVSNAKGFKDELLTIISDGIKDGLGAGQISNEMYKAFEDLANVNWDRLARTEVALAMNRAKKEEFLAEKIGKLHFAPNPEACAICVDLEGDYDIADCPQPVEDTHPNCLCGLEIVDEGPGRYAAAGYERDPNGIELLKKAVAMVERMAA